ncbi:MAG TPA: ArsR family transcriptional regulator [Chloroflexota bacterium]|nr:ArsR family transcriptional regulator [Chloroflexota bacterium]
MANGGWDQRFLATTRGQVVALLWRAPRTVEELAAALGVTDNAVRTHLSSLERDGLVRQDGVRRSGGKPAFVFDVTPAAEQLFPKAYGPVLGQVLDVLAERMPADAIETLLREVGRRLAAEAGAPARRDRGPGDRLQRAVAVLEGLGSIVEVEDDGAQSGKVRLRGYSCPLASAVKPHPEVCRLIESLLAEVVGAPVTECCDRAARPRCGFEMAAGRRRAA